MAQSFYGTSLAITNNVRTLVYNSPAGTTSVLHSIYVANTNDTIDLSVDIEMERATSPGVYTYLGRYIPIPRGGTLIFDKPINFMPGDNIYVTSSFATGTVDVTISTLKIT
jgi:hypothetical protein